MQNSSPIHTHVHHHPDAGAHCVVPDVQDEGNMEISLSWSQLSLHHFYKKPTDRTLKLVLAGLDWHRWISSTCLRMAFSSCVLNDVIADPHPSNHGEDDMKRELFKISAVIFSIKRTGASVSSGPDETCRSSPPV